MPPLVVTQIAVAGVWLYEGLWCKLLGGMPHQLDVVEAVPFFGARSANVLLRAIGIVECGLALWVLSGQHPLLAVLAETGLLIGMNTCGLLWSRRHIPDPAGMVVKNFAFLVLAWVVAAQASSPSLAG